MLSAARLNIPVFVSLVKLILGFVTFPSAKANDPVSKPPTFRFPDIPTPPDTTRAPVVVLVDGVVFVSEVTVDIIVLALPTLTRSTPPVDILTLSAPVLYKAVPLFPYICPLIQLFPLTTHRAYGLAMVTFVPARGSPPIRNDEAVVMVLLATLSVYVIWPID